MSECIVANFHLMVMLTLIGSEASVTASGIGEAIRQGVPVQEAGQVIFEARYALESLCREVNNI